MFNRIIKKRYQEHLQAYTDRYSKQKSNYAKHIKKENTYLLIIEEWIV